MTVSGISEGVLVATISTLVVLLLGYIYRTSILSYVKRIFHSGVNSTGEWNQRQAYSDSGENIEYEKTLSITQSGNKVKGGLTFSKFLDGNKVDYKPGQA